MKTFLIALLVLVILISGVSLYAVYLKNITSELSYILNDIFSLLEKEDWDKCDIKKDSLMEKWQKNESILAMFTDHEDVDKIKLSLGDLNEKISQKDKDEALISLSQIKIMLERFQKNESLTLENILKLSPVYSFVHTIL